MSERFRDLERLEKLARLVYEELSRISRQRAYLRSFTSSNIKFKNLISVASQVLPEHKSLFALTLKEADGNYISSLTVNEARSIILHLLDIIQIEKSSEISIEEMKFLKVLKRNSNKLICPFKKEIMLLLFIISIRLWN